MSDFANTQLSVVTLRDRLDHTWKQHGDLGFPPQQIEAGLSLAEAQELVEALEVARELEKAAWRVCHNAESQTRLSELRGLEPCINALRVVQDEFAKRVQP